MQRDKAIAAKDILTKRNYQSKAIAKLSPENISVGCKWWMGSVPNSEPVKLDLDLLQISQEELREFLISKIKSNIIKLDEQLANL